MSTSAGLYALSFLDLQFDVVLRDRRAASPFAQRPAGVRARDGTEDIVLKIQGSLPCLVAAAVFVGTSALAQDQESVRLLTSDTVAVVDGAALEAAPSLAVAQKTVPPAVEHTGLGTLVQDIIADFKAFPRRESTWVILGMGGATALAVHPADNSVNSHLVSSGWADKLWQPGHIIGGPVMYGVPIALYLGGRYLLPANDEPRTNRWTHLGLDLLRAELEEEAIVQALKFSVRRTRPDGTPHSFPSGHAAATFALASVLERHLGYRLAWPTLVIATYVGTSRLHDNVHYLSDVVFGAAIGTATGWTVVGRHGRSSYAFAPMPVRGGFALMVTGHPTSPPPKHLVARAHDPGGEHQTAPFETSDVKSHSADFARER